MTIDTTFDIGDTVKIIKTGEQARIHKITIIKTAYCAIAWNDVGWGEGDNYHTMGQYLSEQLNKIGSTRN